jgi:hypothetical protein
MTDAEKKAKRSEYLKQWRVKNRERLLEKERLWRKKNKSKVSAHAKKQYRRNRDVRLAYGKQWREKNASRMKELSDRWKEANRSRVNELQKLRYAEDPLKHRKYQRDWRLRHQEVILQREKVWRQNNKHLSRRQCQQRQARKDRQLHPENDSQKELAFYQAADDLMRKTGQIFHVDHIIPLSRGGWHHHDNLQVLPAKINGEKANNPFWEMEGYKSWRDVPRHLWPDKLVEKYLVRILI